MATGLSFINTLCTRSERNLPVLMENSKSHQITLTKGRIEFSSLDVVDGDEPSYQKRSPYELTNAIITTDERFNDCFLLHSAVTAKTGTNFYRSSLQLKIRYFNNLIRLDVAYLRTPEWAKFFPTSCPTEFLVLDQYAAKQNYSWDESTFLWFDRKTLYVQFGDKRIVLR